MEHFVVFFDLGDRLGTANLSPAQTIVSFNAFTYAHTALEEAFQSRFRLGVISNTGTDTTDTINPILQDAGLLQFFDESLLLYSGNGNPRKDSPIAFENAAVAVGLQEDASQ